MAGIFVHPLPTAHPGGAPGAAGSGWASVDVLGVALAGITDGGGAATLTFPQVNAGERWQIQRAVAACSSASPQPRLRLYVNDPTDQRNLRSGTDAAGYDEAEYPDGLWLFETDTLVAVFTGGPAGAQVSIALQYQLWRS